MIGCRKITIMLIQYKSQVIIQKLSSSKEYTGLAFTANTSILDLSFGVNLIRFLLPLTSSSSTVVLLLSDDSWRSEIHSEFGFRRNSTHICAKNTWRHSSQEWHRDLFYIIRTQASRGCVTLSPCQVFTKQKLITELWMYQCRLMQIKFINRSYPNMLLMC